MSDVDDWEVARGFGLDGDSSRRALVRARELRARLADAAAKKRREGLRVVKGGRDGEDRGPVATPDEG